jgi:hypothetical protein
MQFSFCPEQPCLARVEGGAVLMHVDDLLVCGDREFFHKTFFKKAQEKFQVSFTELGGVGTSISFLKKRMTQLEDGILVTPGISSEKIVEACEQSFGAVRAQLVPCDNSIQLEDVSQPLKPEDTSNYRSIVGMALYLGRDRPDLIFTIKELAGKMSRPLWSPCNT